MSRMVLSQGYFTVNKYENELMFDQEVTAKRESDRVKSKIICPEYSVEPHLLYSLLSHD